MLNWYYANNFSNNSNLTVNISKIFLETLPIKLVDKSQLESFNNLHAKLEDTYGTPSFENHYTELNIKFFGLYELAYDEVRTIASEFPLSQEAYDNYEV